MSQEHKDVRQRLARLTTAQRSLLAKRLGTAKNDARGRFAHAAAEAVPPLVSVDRSRALPASWSQQRLWFLQQLDPAAGAAYHIPTGLRLQGELHRDALQAALDALVARHEVLRTSFAVRDDEPLQQIARADVGFCLIEHDLSGLPAATRQRRIEEISACEAGEPFDLSSGPLIRGQLLQLGQEDHLLLITQHHIVSDGWSSGVMVREIAALYGAFSQGRPSPLPALQIQYADYAVWQRQWLQGEALQAQIEFWKSQLAGAPDLLALPTDRPRPGIQSYAGAHVELRLPGALVLGLRRLSQRREVTLFMTLLAGWAACLSRFSGESDLVIGVPVANRRRSELESLIGFFSNTLALRVRLDCDPTVAELLAHIKDNTLQAYANQDIPFAQVVEVLQPPRSLSYNPIFQVALAFDNAPGERVLSLPGLSVTKFDLPLSGAKFDLSLSLRDSGDAVEGVLEYATDLFDRPTIERMSGHLLCLLEAMVADDRQRISELNLLSAAQREQLLVRFNEAPAVHGKSGLIHEWFEAQARRTPDALAVMYEGESLTYAQLNGRANQLARYLRERGVGADQRVGICVERSLQMVLGLLGILKAGGAYVPMDPSSSAERLAYLLEDAAPRVLLIQEPLRARLPATSVGVVALDSEWREIARCSAENLDTERGELGAHHLAYVIYTSGSTGHPKGVMVEHGNVTRLFSTTQAWFHFNERDVWTLFHSFAFDFSVWELWGALLYGGRLVVVPHLTARSAPEFYRLVCEQGVTVLNQTPSAFARFIDAQAQSTQRHALRVVIFGGEALEFRSLKPWLKRHEVHQPQLVNMYGITETTVHVSYRALSEEDVNSERSSLIGNPIADLKMYLLDRHRQPVPLGVRGEIYVSGAGVARGYLNRAQLTAERFLDDPFSGAAPARMYRTGDLARRRADGALEYLGRNDQQVKIRGFRIELGEIEVQLRRHPQLKEALVVARDEGAGEKRLVAYVIPDKPADAQIPLCAETLRTHLQAVLPEYMIPSAFVRLAAFPLTANGKLDREALPAPDQNSVASAQYEAPRGEIETIIAGIFEDLLKVPRIGRNDNFFDLGGHSLLLLKVLAAMRAKIGRPPIMAWLFQAPTPAQLAALVSRKRIDETWKHLVQLNEGVDRDPLFFLNGFNGNLDDYLNIVRFIEPSLPIYGLQVETTVAENADIRESLNSRMESYERELRCVQPRGPYRLCGYSFGGSEAFELARRLEDSGEEVLLILLDAYRQSKSFRLQSWLPRILMMIRSGTMLTTARRKLLNLYRYELHRWVTRRDRDLKHALTRNAKQRRFKPFSGRVVLFKSDGFEQWAYQPRLDGFNGWKNLVAGRIEVIRIHCGHEGLVVDPAVKSVVQHLNAIL